MASSCCVDAGACVCVERDCLVARRRFRDDSPSSGTAKCCCASWGGDWRCACLSVGQRDSFMRFSTGTDPSLASLAESAGERSSGGVNWPNRAVDWVRRFGGMVNGDVGSTGVAELSLRAAHLLWCLAASLKAAYASLAQSKECGCWTSIMIEAGRCQAKEAQRWLDCRRQWGCSDVEGRG